jgi:cellobiose phosphorylase
LGASSNDECRVDSISQSWAVISGAGDALRARQAMGAVDRLLVDREAALIKLLDPPFDTSVLEPGYIKGYVPGVRENGGQYTHAAIWAAMAFAMMGDTGKAWELFSMLNPIHHGASPENSRLYKVEPYVMSADVYGAPPHTGRGGWTWYTGAAGWMYRLAVETLMGLHLEADRLRLEPLIPDDWDSYKVHYRYRETFYHITFGRTNDRTLYPGSDGPVGAARVRRIALDGADLEQAGPLKGAIPLVDDRRDHTVEVELG